MSIEKDEELKSQAIGWAAAVVAILIGLAMGAGTFSVLLGLVAAVSTMIWRIKKLERKAVAK